MVAENPIPLQPSDGVDFSSSRYASGKGAGYIQGGGGQVRIGSGRWSNATNMEFIADFAQKIAGWVSASATQAEGVPRAQTIWRDAQGLARSAIGTSSHLYSWQANVLTDVTPLTMISSGTLTDAITTTNASLLVAIADASQKLVNGDRVFLSAQNAVGGVLLNGWYQVSSVTGSGYNVTVPVAASSSAGPLGGTIQFQYPRINLSGPFTTTLGSATVTVAHTAHGRVAGDFVAFSGATAVGGLTLNGEFQVVTAATDTYTITASSNATSGASGGGTVSTIYLLHIAQTNPGNFGAWGSGGVWGSAGTWGFLGGQAPPVITDGWTLSAYGSQMLAAPVGGTIYIYDTATGGRAYPMLNAPGTVLAMFVTAERFVVALGINGNLMEMAWADQDNYTIWTTLPTNTANSGRTLVGGSYFVGGISVRNGLSLIWTDTSIFQMNYTAGQEIYATPIAGNNCGLISPWAMCTEGEIAYWMSDQDWWTWNGSPQALPSDDVRASVYQATPEDGDAGLNRGQLSKAIAVMNREKKQVRFFWPSAVASENDGGMIFQFDSPSWSPLSFGRASGCDSMLIRTPMSCDQSGNVFFDESGVDANGTPLPCSIEMALMDVSNGQLSVDIFGFLPDFKTLVGTAVFNAIAAFYPDGVTTMDGPWPITRGMTRQDLRLDGKMFAFNLSLNGLGWTMRLGINRLDIQNSGARV